MFIQCSPRDSKGTVLIESSSIVSISPAVPDPASDIPATGTLIRTLDNRSWMVTDTAEAIVAALMACDKRHFVVHVVDGSIATPKKKR